MSVDIRPNHDSMTSCRQNTTIGAKMAKENKKNTSLRLEANVLKELKILAIQQDTSVQAIVESLITNFIEKHDKKGTK